MSNDRSAAELRPQDAIDANRLVPVIGAAMYEQLEFGARQYVTATSRFAPQTEDLAAHLSWRQWLDLTRAMCLRLFRRDALHRQAQPQAPLVAGCEDAEAREASPLPHSGDLK